MAHYSDVTVPSIDPGWSDNAAPLNQTRETTRDDLRRMMNLPVSLDGLVTITRSMNTVAELSPETVTYIESSLAEHKTLETSRTSKQEQGGWDGAAPLRKADVVEYDTSLLADPNSIVIQTQGINARMGQIEMEIRVALNLQSAFPYGGRLYRS